MNDDCFHTESLDQFTADLEADGCVAIAGYPYPAWRGAIDPAFAGLTDAAHMDIIVVPGWPFRPPMLFVQGLNTNHATADGFVCMWQDEDSSLEWTTAAGFLGRIPEWCAHAKQGWQNDDLQADAYLNFRHKALQVAAFDLTELRVTSGGWGECHGVIDSQTHRVDIKPGISRSGGNRLRGLWFHAGTLKEPPPRQLSEISRHLSRQQRKGLQKAIGRCDLLLFCWERNAVPNLLILACRNSDDKTEAYAMLPGPKDEPNLILRAGPDAHLLRTRKAALFGAGALGGYVAASIAQSGLGALDIVDGDLLLPGNVARHVAGHQHTGNAKAAAVQSIIADHAPWTQTAIHLEAPFTPEGIRRRIADADLVIDATGNAAFIDPLALVAKDFGKPLVSGALYRGGAIGRVRRQVLPEDTPINQREEPQYRFIPLGDAISEFITPETGCSAPVNNAPPASVTACASRIVQIAVDALSNRFQYGDEVIDVYWPLGEPPFDRIGAIAVAR